jgi:sterol desaturase/sphingolipid hydroxylase (fatty acid hydroxylase superfamily)
MANVGRAWRVLADNRFHRIHHSLEREHWDKNFGVVMTIWDQLFGTSYFPAPEEWPAVGVHDRPEPANLIDYFLAPFKRKRPAAIMAPAE